MKKLLVFLILIFVIHDAFSQQLSNKTDHDKLNTDFAYRVKIIDEFFDRFNAKPDILLTRFIRKNNQGATITRPKLIASLLNMSNKPLLNDSLTLLLISEAVDSLKPQFLSFYDTNWYAVLKCKVLYKSKPVQLKLTMRIDYHVDQSVEWTLYDADASFIRKMNFNPDSFLFANNLLKYFLRTGDSIKYYLHGMSHGIDFMNLNEAFINKSKFINYTFRSQPNAALKKLFIASINNQFKFVQVDSISFFMFQLPGKIIRVEEFNRTTNNSGWLINNINAVNDQMKNDFLRSVAKLN